MRVRNYSLRVRPFRQGQESRLLLAGGIVTPTLGKSPVKLGRPAGRRPRWRLFKRFQEDLMKVRKTVMSLLLTLALAWAFPAFGQSDRGAITGTVKDQNGGAVPNAKVTATNIDTGEARKTTTGNEGSFTLSELKAASYRLTVEATSFKTASIDRIQL